MAEFFHMGGYGFYVWSSYGVVTAVLGWHYVAPLVKEKKLLAELAREQAPRKITSPGKMNPREK